MGLHNSGFMHTLLCTSAVHLYLSGKLCIDTVIHHRTEAIAAINLAISDPNPAFRISDANIGAVFNLLTVEETLAALGIGQNEIEEHFSSLQVHLRGLRSMIRLRGGLTALNSNRLLQAHILW